MYKAATVFLALGLASAIVTAGFAQEIPSHQFYDLNDNLVPANWTQETMFGGPGVTDGKFWGRTTDGRAWLRQHGVLPDDATEVRFEYDGNIAYSYWGMANAVAVVLSSGVEYMVSDGMAEYNYGTVNRVRFDRSDAGTFHYESYPFETTDYHYTAIFSDGQMKYKAEKLSDGSILFDLTVAAEDLTISEVEQIFFFAKTTTGNHAWMDNLLVTVTGGGSSSTTYLVSPDGSGDFLTIQEAVNAATHGDVIELACDQVYAGGGNRDVNVSGKAITIRSECGVPERCVVDLGGVAGHIGFIFSSGETGTTILQGITIQNAWNPGSGGGVFITNYSSPTIENCVLRNNTAYAGAGIFAHDSHSLISHCVFDGNETVAGQDGAGIDCGNTSPAIPTGPTVSSCTFVNNTASNNGGGLCSVHPGCNPSISRCIFMGNHASSRPGGAVGCQDQGTVSIECSDLYGNTGSQGNGDWAGCIASQGGLNGNLSADPLFCDAAGQDYYLQSGSPCENAGGCGLVGALPVGCDPSQGSLTADISLDWPGDMVWGASLGYSLPEGDEVESITLQVNGHDVSSQCYLSTANCKLTSPAFVMLRNMPIVISGTIVTVNGLQADVEQAFDVYDVDIQTIFSRLNDLPLSVLAEFLPETDIDLGALADALAFTEALIHVTDGDNQEAIETLVGHTLNRIPPLAVLDFAVGISGLEEMIFVQPMQGIMSDEDFEDYQNDQIMVKMVKQMTYMWVPYATFLDQFSLRFPPGFTGEFSIGGVPEVPTEYGLWQLLMQTGTEIAEKLEDVNTWIHEHWDLFWQGLTFSPIDVVIVGPEGDSLSKTVRDIPRSMYVEEDVSDPDIWEDAAALYRPATGWYAVLAVPEESAQPEDTFSLIVVSGPDTTVLASDEPIGTISTEPYYVFIGALASYVDVKPGSCPNSVNLKSKGVTPMAIVGAVDFDVHEIDISSMLLEGTVAPTRFNYEDVSTPIVASGECECVAEGPDGFEDLTLKFRTQDLKDALGPVQIGEEVVLTLTGTLLNGTPFEGTDCIVVRGRQDREQTLPDHVRLRVAQQGSAEGLARISYALPSAAHVRLSVFDVSGRLVKILADERREAGEHTIAVDTADLQSSVYICRLQAGDIEETSNLVIAK
ncbi:right-handed parallel beta-helix repeat-containing protein [Candidatus Eisenbacteria bacterium]|uniref:Right-handed parallel beta-helix repeat-containing protein n=1 Tax=Eiseniibacteriota bacterium TaxID=2212470 RepID=A0ABV6YK26_UNCEI